MSETTSILALTKSISDCSGLSRLTTWGGYASVWEKKGSKPANPANGVIPIAAPAVLNSVAVTPPKPGVHPLSGAPTRPKPAPKFGTQPGPNGLPEYATGAVSPLS